MLYFDLFCAWMFHNFYLSLLWSLLVNAASNTSPNLTMKYKEKVWNLFKVNNEDTRRISMFLNVSMYVNEVILVNTATLECFSISSFNNLFHLIQGAWWGKHVHLLTSQGAQNYKVHNVLLNLLLGVQTFVYQNT